MPEQAGTVEAEGILDNLDWDTRGFDSPVMSGLQRPELVLSWS